MLLRPLPYPNASELVAVVQVATETGASRPISPPNYFDLREQSKSFSGIAAYWSPSVSISGTGIEPEKVLAATCSSDLFRVLGIAPAAGRGFVDDDDRPGAQRVAILGHGLWQRRFGGDAGAVGRELMLDGVPALIVGVMPRGFEFPTAGTELWVPLRLSRSQPPNPAIRAEAYRQYRILRVVARLDGGATSSARAPSSPAWVASWRVSIPDANRGADFAVVPLHDTVVGAVRPALLLLAAAVGVRAAGRVRERRQFDAGACRAAHARGDDPDGARRRPGTAGAPDDHREPAPGASPAARSRLSSARGRSGCSCDSRRRTSRDSTRCASTDVRSRSPS